MNGKLTIIYSDGTKETPIYESVEIAEQHERDIKIALGTNIQFTCVEPTSEPATITETEYSVNPLDDMDFDDDDEDYLFDIPSDMLD